jgi:hypothetical protein
MFRACFTICLFISPDFIRRAQGTHDMFHDMFAPKIEHSNDMFHDMFHDMFVLYLRNTSEHFTTTICRIHVPADCRASGTRHLFFPGGETTRDAGTARHEGAKHMPAARLARDRS